MLKTLLSLALLVAATATSGFAAPILIGVFSGNDKIEDVQAAIFSVTGLTPDLTLYDKSDSDPLLTTVTSSSDGKSGTWDVIDNSVKIAFVTVKASNNFAIYQYLVPVNSGDWTTAGIVNNGGNQPKLSHLSFWTIPSEVPENPVPEPSSIILMGSAAVALIGLKKRFAK